MTAKKLDALTYHMSKKDTDLQTELTDTVQKLYEKHVPQATREYIDDKLSREAAANPKPKDRFALLRQAALKAVQYRQAVQSGRVGGCVALCGLLAGRVALDTESAKIMPTLCPCEENVRKPRIR